MTAMTKISRKNPLLKKIKNQHKKPSLHLISTKESWRLLKNNPPCSNLKKENFYFKSKKKKKSMLKINPKNKTLKIFINLEISTNLNISLTKQQKVNN